MGRHLCVRVLREGLVHEYVSANLPGYAGAC